MPDILVSGVSEMMMTELSKRAADHHCSPTEEARSILSDALLASQSKSWAGVDAIYDRLKKSGHQFSDSAESIREDRDR